MEFLSDLTNPLVMILWSAVGIVLLIGIWKLFRGANKVIDKGIQKFKDLWNPVVSRLGGVNPQYYQEKGKIVLKFGLPKEVTNLVKIEQKFSFEHEFSNKAWCSEKKVTVCANFKAHAGIKLNDSQFRFIFPPGNALRPQIEGVKATLISCEVIEGSISMKENNGWWNRINESDRAATLNTLIEKARHYVLKETDDFFRQIGVYEVVGQYVQDVPEQLEIEPDGMTVTCTYRTHDKQAKV